MPELEDNVVEGSFKIPPHINSKGTSEVILRSEVECAQENSDVVDDTPKTMRKRRSSNEKEQHVGLGEVDVNAPSKKRGKPKGSQKNKEQPPLELS